MFNFDNLHIQVFLVTGGWDENFYNLDSTEVYNPNVGSWTVGTSLPKPLIQLSATNIEGRVFIFGKDIPNKKIITGS